MDEQTTNSRQPADSTPEESGGQGERRFTQEEVNRIVSERLARAREKRGDQPGEEEREQALKAREARMDCRDYLDSMKYPAKLLDILDSSHPERFRTEVQALVEAFPDVLATFATRGAETPSPPVRFRENPDAEIAKAFLPKI